MVHHWPIDVVHITEHPKERVSYNYRTDPLKPKQIFFLMSTILLPSCSLRVFSVTHLKIKNPQKTTHKIVNTQNYHPFQLKKESLNISHHMNLRRKKIDQSPRTSTVAARYVLPPPNSLQKAETRPRFAANDSRVGEHFIFPSQLFVRT